MTPPHPTIPCHVIAGPLGVGKTSTILNYLRHHAADQCIGVLVNDFGPIGLDSTSLQAEAPRTKVLNIPGGCICCTMLAELPASIGRIRSEQALDRLIIEPSGIASPAQVINVLRQTQAELGISLQPAIAILSASNFDADTFERMGYYQVFCETADILVFNRCDQANDTKINAARTWAENLNPPKLRVVTTEHGRLPAEVFDLTADSQRTDEPAGHKHHHHHDPTVHPGGFVLEAEQRFEENGLLVNLMRICHQGIDENQVLRLKGVFHTNDGWQSIEIANREVSVRPSAHRRDNRMEWLTQPGPICQKQVLAEITRPLN